MGTERKSAFIDAKAKLATAYHEVRRKDRLASGPGLISVQGGHALVALWTEGAIPLHKVTCIPRGHALGYVGSVLWS